MLHALELMSSKKIGSIVFLALLYSCAPRPVSQAPAILRPAPPEPSRPLASSPRATETRPLLEEAKIKEQPLPEKRPTPPVVAKAPLPGPTRVTEPPAPAPRAETSLIAKINSKTPPQRAASLRLTEEGRKFLEAGEYSKALARLEKTITIDSTNPYGYFYLARAHYYLGRFQESLNFLDVAESLLPDQTYWLSEVFALRGENFRALGVLLRADFNYSEALRLNPENPVAAEGAGKIKSDLPFPSR